MKKLCFSSVYLLVTIIFINGCGNDEGDPTLVDCTLSPIVVETNTTSENCGLSDGIVVITASGGDGNFSYSVDDGTTFQATGTFNNLTSGTYPIVVRDANDCESTSNVTLANVGGVTISIDNTVNATCDTSVGEITASSTGGSNIQFKLDDGALQSSGTFTGLAAGTYTVHAVEASTGCETTVEETILSGISFASSIQNIITTKCATTSGCHVSGSTGRQDFTTFSTIQSNAAGIKSRTQSGNMPKSGSITQEQKDLIACWVDDGALNN